MTFEMNKQWRNLKEQTATEHDYLKEIENFKRVVKEITEERDKIRKRFMIEFGEGITVMLSMPRKDMIEFNELIKKGM